MKRYTVRQLADMAGVSVRTLHHYDRIGLLRPAGRSGNGYRLYGRGELLRLQQILFYRELDFPLEEIASVLDSPGFDPLAALERHGAEIRKRIGRLTGLLETVEKTAELLKGEQTMMSDEELYEGFKPGEGKKYTEEARTMWGATVDEVNAKIRNLSKEQWNRHRQEGDEITRKLAALADRAPGDPEVQAQIRRHHAWIEFFFPANAEIYRGLGAGYADDPRFRATYDRYRKDLSDFLKQAIDWFCDHELKNT